MTLPQIAMFIACAGTAIPVWADNGAKTDMDVVVSVQNAMICDILECKSTNNVQPVEIVKEGEVVYVW